MSTPPRSLPPSPGPPPPAEAAQERCASTSRYRTLYAYNHLLTLTIATMTDRALHQPWVHVSSDLYEPAYHVPQARMSMQGSPRRCCRALLRWPLRWPARLQRPLELAAHARHRRQRWWRVHPCGARERSTLGGGYSPRVGRATAERLRRMRMACMCRSRREIGGAGSPECLRGRPGRAGPGLAVPHGPSGVGRGTRDPRRGPLCTFVHAHLVSVV